MSIELFGLRLPRCSQTFGLFLSALLCGAFTSARATAQVPAAERGILEGNYHNPPYAKAGANWARDLCTGKEWLKNASPRYEWTQVMEPTEERDHQIVTASGWAFSSNASTADVPFTHPFGFDWTWMLAPDSATVSLIAGAPPDSEHQAAIQQATNAGLHSVADVMHIETDIGLLPVDFRPQNGDRNITFGRWIVDCGHDPFRTEIHPPLVVVNARTTSSQATHSTIIARPVLVSQEFKSGALRAHLIKEIVDVIPKIPGLPVPFSTHVQAHPRLLPPFSGLQWAGYYVRPPGTRRSPDDSVFVRYHFTARTGVAAQVSRAGDGVVVFVVMNDVDYPPVAPLLEKTKHKRNYSLDNLDVISEGLGTTIKLVLAGAAFGGPAVVPDPLLWGVTAAVVGQGVETSEYTALASAIGGGGARISVDKLAGISEITVDNSQPFPLAGWVDVEWKRARQVPPVGWLSPAWLAVRAAQDNTDAARNSRTIAAMRQPAVTRLSPGSVVRAVAEVDASEGWTGTGIQLSESDSLIIDATGQWSNGGANPRMTGPAGFPGVLTAGTLLGSANLGALVGRIGNSVFLIGSHFSGRSPHNGELFLAMNDVSGTLMDNNGTVRVAVVKAIGRR